MRFGDRRANCRSMLTILGSRTFWSLRLPPRAAPAWDEPPLSPLAELCVEVENAEVVVALRHFIAGVGDDTAAGSCAAAREENREASKPRRLKDDDAMTDGDGHTSPRRIFGRFVSRFELEMGSPFSSSAGASSSPWSERPRRVASGGRRGRSLER